MTFVGRGALGSTRALFQVLATSRESLEWQSWGMWVQDWAWCCSCPLKAKLQLLLRSPAAHPGPARVQLQMCSAGDADVAADVPGPPWKGH